MKGTTRRSITRRTFVRTGVVVAAGVASGACRSGARPARSLVRGCCAHDCPDTCSWIVTTEDGAAVGLAGDPDHPFTRGELCVKMDGFLDDVVYNPERLLHPLKRIGGKGEGRFERVGWDEALDDVAARLSKIVEQHGAEAILPYSYGGTEGQVQGKSIDRRFFARLGASRLERTICGGTEWAGLSATMGSGCGILPEDLLQSRLIVMWGGNPVVSNPHGWKLVEEARATGARLVVIDPLRSPTAERADLHLRPRPGTDAALALGMMHVIVGEGLHDSEYLARHCVGFERLRERLAEYPPQRVAEITGIEEGAITDFARSYATTRPAAIQVHIGMEKHHQGGASYRAIACLPAVVGSWRERGGGLLAFAVTVLGAVPGLAGDQPETRAINMVQLGRALTDPALAPALHGLVVYNSNPATIAPNQNLVVQGLRREDLFTVVLEHFVTDTALYADYVLPATTQAEHLDLVVPYGTRYLALNQPAIAPRGEALPNTEIFRRLARRMGFDEPDLQTSDEELVQTALRSDHPFMEGITYERLQADGWAPLAIPEPYLPFAEGGFPTTSGKCELYSESLAGEGLDPLPGWTAHERPADETVRYPLHFMSPKWNRYFVNSSHANQPRLEVAAGRPRLRIHPADAAARGIVDGDPVRVFNDRGEVVLEALVTDAMQVGVVILLHGWWASRIGGSSANALTGDTLADLGGGSTLHDNWVEVGKPA